MREMNMTEPVHIVENGQNAWTILKKYNKQNNTNISLDQLKEMNPQIKDLNKLKPGDKLIFSSPQEPQTVTSDKTNISTTLEVGKGQNAWVILQNYNKQNNTNISLDQLKEMNPQIKDLSKLKPGDKLIFSPSQETQTVAPEKINSSSESIFTQQASDAKPKTDTSDVKNTTLTQAKYEENQPEEVKNLKTFIKNKEGKESSTYVALEGNATIAYGHVLESQPQFIKDIAKSTNKKDERAKLLKKALEDDNNKKILKAAIEKDLQAAVKLTGIGNVSIDISDDLKLTDAQMELLLNADIKKVYNAMEKKIGKANLDKRTTNEKQAALDMFYNAGGNLDAPKFIEAFSKGDILKAQEEIDFFTAKVYNPETKKKERKYFEGLIKRCYERMLLINNNELTVNSQTKLRAAYNKYLAQDNKPPIETFEKLEPLLKK